VDWDEEVSNGARAGAAATFGTTTLEAPASRPCRGEAEATQLALVVAWSESEPGRVGEVLFPTHEPSWFGRHTTGDHQQRLRLIRQRPGRNEPSKRLDNPFLSRRHLELERLDADTLSVRCEGRRALRAQGTESTQLELRRGDTFEIRGLYAFVCVERPLRLEAGRAAHEFGEVDEHGVVGESPAAWALRQRIAFCADRAAHVLITGASGTGKELVARAIHASSSRRRKALVSRNAATFPPGLIDAELFGNVANYPNAGMPERPGLVGQAVGSTLFLDEIGELPSELQAHLLRVLDSGEYQRLGDARPRTVDLRLVAATNRAATELKEDLAARLTLRLRVPSLDERVEDVPLIARHIILRIARDDAAIAERYVRGWNGHGGEPRFSSELITHLLRHRYLTQVRELEALLWRSVQSSSGGVLELTPDVRCELRLGAPTRAPSREISADALRAALERHGGVKDRVWRELGLSSRHALLRLMRKLGEL
jgi:DNA-binding NtrC family response regulator